MKSRFLFVALLIGYPFITSLRAQRNIQDFPNTVISNKYVKMKLLLPDPEKGAYQATRFDWSGIIASLQYEGHEYFEYWKNTHDPVVHEDISGPAESFNHPGLGYAEAKPGEGFIRIGVGILEKPDESTYRWSSTYKIIDHGKWEVDHGKDWIEFRHTIASDFGYGYIYTKRIELKQDEPGFQIIHVLKNAGLKTIETDQYNHNFFVIDGQKSGPGFSFEFPFEAKTENELKGLMAVKGNHLWFLKSLENNHVWMELTGFGSGIEDHQVTIHNKNSGAGVRFQVNKPLHRMVFWACETTYCPENFIYLSVLPGEDEKWISDYTLFLEGK